MYWRIIPRKKKPVNNHIRNALRERSDRNGGVFGNDDLDFLEGVMAATDETVQELIDAIMANGAIEIYEIG